MEVSAFKVGGVLAQYWHNLRMHDQPRLQRFDTQIWFEWDHMITQDAYDFVSIRWSGLITAPYSEMFTFIFNSTGASSRLSVAGKLLFDDYVDGVIEADSSTRAARKPQYRIRSGRVAMLAQEAQQIRLDYQHTSGPASAHLQWISKSQALETVPSHRLYHAFATAKGSPFSVAVKSNANDSTVTDMTGNALSTATAGVAASFRVHVRDVYGNVNEGRGRESLHHRSV